jgi:hypothetical protein
MNNQSPVARPGFLFGVIWQSPSACRPGEGRDEEKTDTQHIGRVCRRYPIVAIILARQDRFDWREDICQFCIAFPERLCLFRITTNSFNLRF